VVKLAFDSQFKKNTGFFEFPKLKLEMGEKARICIIDSAPEAKYVHTLRKIILDQGRPVMMIEKYGKNNDKEREVPKTEFVGKFLCLGDDSPGGPLDENEVDPDNCPACKVAIESGGAVEKPQRRIVFHVIKYKTTKGSFNIQKPFQVELVAWDITDNRFSTLLDIKDEHGDLAGLDLTLGPCENANYQKFDIKPGARAEWSVDDDRKKLVHSIWKENKSDSLHLLLGREVSAAEMRGYVNDVVRQYNLGFGSNNANAMPSVNTNADLDLSAALSEGDEAKTGEADFFANPDFPTPSTEAPETSETSEPSNDELAAAAGVEMANAAAQEKPKKVEDLDDLLKDFA
jgi:hypothetical protein